MNTIPWETIINSLVEGLFPIALALAAWLFKVLAQKTGQTIKNEALVSALWKLEKVTEVVVLAVSQNFVTKVKGLSVDGKLDMVDAGVAKESATNKIKSHLGEEGFKALAKGLSLSDKDLDALIDTMIEAAVAKTKGIK
jgi:hypothetical protein